MTLPPPLRCITVAVNANQEMKLAGASEGVGGQDDVDVSDYVKV